MSDQLLLPPSQVPILFSSIITAHYILIPDYISIDYSVTSDENTLYQINYFHPQSSVVF